MKTKKHLTGDSDNSGSIMFGFDRTTDEKSLAAFLQIIANSDMLDKLIPKLKDQEIESVVDLFMGLMKNHLSKNEYHRLFLGEK